MKRFFFAAALLLLGGFAVQGAPVNLTDTLSCGLPKGWKAYGMGGSCRAENGALRITATDPKREWGISKVFEAGKPGKYTFSVEVSRPADGLPNGNMQIFMIAGAKQGSRGIMGTAQSGSFIRISATVEIFKEDQNITVYIHSSLNETGDFLIRNAQFQGVSK